MDVDRVGLKAHLRPIGRERLDLIEKNDSRARRS
jgi:hypothetical protein